MFVVVVSDSDVFRDLKVFGNMSDARALAEERVQEGYIAKVYGVPLAQSPLDAKAAVEMGTGEFLYAPAHKPPETDIGARVQRNVRIRRLKPKARPIDIDLW